MRAHRGHVSCIHGECGARTQGELDVCTGCAGCTGCVGCAKHIGGRVRCTVAWDEVMERTGGTQSGPGNSNLWHQCATCEMLQRHEVVRKGARARPGMVWTRVNSDQGLRYRLNAWGSCGKGDGEYGG